MLTDFYVSAADGANFPNDGSVDEPFQTIGRAVQFAQPWDTIYIREGVYRETVNVTRSGTAAAPITFRAYQGEEVVISSADVVTGWTQANIDIDGDGNVDPNVWVANVTWDFNDDRDANTLFVNGELQHEARHFAEGDGINDIDQWGSLPRGRVNAFGTTLDTDDLTAYPDEYWNGGTIKFHVHDWAFQRRTITDFDSATGVITLDSDLGNAGQKREFGYYIYDTIRALDKPGEWYKAEGDSNLYYQAEPGQDPNNLEIEFKHRQYGMNREDRSHIRVQGIEFRGCALNLNANSDNSVYQGNEFHGYNNGDAGRFFYQGDHTVFRDNEVYDVYATGLEIAGSRHEIVNNHFYNVGFGDNRKVLSATDATDLLLSHNTFEKFSSGLFNGYPIRGEIAYNVFQNATPTIWDTEVFDSDARNGINSFAIIHHNILRDIDAHGQFEGFYGRTNNQVVHHNLIYNFSPGGNRPVFRSTGIEFRQAYHNTIISGVEQAPGGTTNTQNSIQTRYNNNNNNNVQVTLADMEAIGVDLRGNHNYSLVSDSVNATAGDFRL